MSALPDEMWRRILELGIERCGFSHKDLCCLSMSTRRFRRLSGEPSLWSSLLSSDFPDLSKNSYPSASISLLSRDGGDTLSSAFKSRSRSSPKTLYQLRYEKEKARRAAAHRRAMLRMESRIWEHSSRIHELLAQKANEVRKLQEAATELSNLHKVSTLMTHSRRVAMKLFHRQASTALNVWQPEIVRGRQKQVVEQCRVPVEARINALQMEIKLCNQQMTALDKAHRVEKQRLTTAKEQLASMRYHPLRDFSESSSGINDSNRKRKKPRISSIDQGSY